eukprot:1042269-Rhodomonas_salina.3
MQHVLPGAEHGVAGEANLNIRVDDGQKNVGNPKHQVLSGWFACCEVLGSDMVSVLARREAVWRVVRTSTALTRSTLSQRCVRPIRVGPCRVSKRVRLRLGLTEAVLLRMQASTYSGTPSEADWMRSESGSRHNSLNVVQSRDRAITPTNIISKAPKAPSSERVTIFRQESDMIDRICLEVEALTAAMDSAFLHSTDIPWLRKVPRVYTAMREHGCGCRMVMATMRTVPPTHISRQKAMVGDDAIVIAVMPMLRG